MKEREVDVAIIGAGSAGLSAYRAARKRGARTVLIESGPYGTTCARVGCMPSKLLIAAANACHDTRLLDGFGITLDGPARVDGPRVLERVRRERDRFVKGVVDEVDAYPAQDKLCGKARFLSDHVLTVDGTLSIHTRATVIATGSESVIPAAYRDLGPALAISDDVFEWRTLPRRVAVIGTGVVAMELGQALSRLGVDVAMFGKGGSIAGISDPKVSDYALKTFQREFPIYPNTDVVARATPEGGAEFRFAGPDGAPLQRIFDRVLVAAGRAPRLESLDLANTSVRCDDHGVPRFDPDTLQCLHAPIFIAGDANRQRPWLNDAANEGHIAGDNAGAWPEGKPQQRPAVLSIVFSEPNILLAGTALKSLDDTTIVTGEIAFEHQGRSTVAQRAHGLLRVYADVATGRILGAEGIAPAGEHLAHLIAWSVQQQLTLDQMLAMPFYHPVFEEGLRTALRDAAKARAKRLPCPETPVIGAPGA
jgi:dihydrolipoamide dehydrogenase